MHVLRGVGLTLNFGRGTVQVRGRKQVADGVGHVFAGCKGGGMYCFDEVGPCRLGQRARNLENQVGNTIDTTVVR